jgi:hypothetical protein
MKTRATSATTQAEAIKGVARADTSTASMTLQRRQQLANSSPVAMQLKQQTAMMAACVTGQAVSSPVVQLERLYDDTLSPHKTKLLQWLVEENRTLGLSQAGDSSDDVANKKSNFSWHHILAFADLSVHGESKTSPSNHGGNVRLGPMKNRLESSSVSGGTAVDYGYLPLDSSGNIVLDEYSKGIFDGNIKAADKSSLLGKLSPGTHASTPQALDFTKEKGPSTFGEWFLETQVKNTLLSRKAIAGKLGSVPSGKIDTFVAQINQQFTNLLRTYKFYDKKKEVQTTSGVAMTDISEGNFGHIVVKKGLEDIKASTVMDELLRDQKWVMRGSQGAIQDEATTYKFGIASYDPFTTLVERAAAAIDLAEYKQTNLDQFKLELIDSFTAFKENGREGENFDEDKEGVLIDKLVTKLGTGTATTYESLWSGVVDGDVEDQYVKVNVGEELDDEWAFPVPEVPGRRSAITNTPSGSVEHPEVCDAWNAQFVAKLKDWDNETLLFEEGMSAKEQMYIKFTAVGNSIKTNEQAWNLKGINSERPKGTFSALPKTFIPQNMTVASVKNAVAEEIDDNQEKYLPDDKVGLTLTEVKDALKDVITPHFNVFSKRLKGVGPDLAGRRLAFGADFEGFINSTKWNILHATKMPTNVRDAVGKKWDDLGAAQDQLYRAWLLQSKVSEHIERAAVSGKLIPFLP